MCGNGTGSTFLMLRFWANPQKYQTLVPAKNSHLKVLLWMADDIINYKFMLSVVLLHKGCHAVYYCVGLSALVGKVSCGHLTG